MPDSRRYPSHPVLAVSGVIVNSDGRVLIVRRVQQPGNGLWSLPGGGVELGETLHDALHREIREECGFMIEIGGLLGAFDRIFPDQNGRIEYHYVILTYLCHSNSTQLEPGSEIDDFAWIAAAELANFTFTPGVEDFLRDGFRQGRFRPRTVSER